MWFNEKHLELKKSIILTDLHGYVLPHAGTEYTGRIISHTLRFKPKKKFDSILIIYNPVSKTPNVQNKYFHEYYVVFKSMQYAVKNWNMSNKTFIGLNVQTELYKLQNINLDNTLIVVSADFSHYMPMQEAIKLENCAAKSILHRSLQKNRKCIKVIDHVDNFKLLYELLPDNLQLQWIGRSRSNGMRAVGYLSFLIREKPNPINKPPDGIFVTAYDNMMRQRECLGEWFRNKKWSKSIEQTLINKVVNKGQQTSRLTGGMFLDYPITHITIAYLYKSTHTNFIRGWHGMLHNAFYLSDVFLENTYENGKWITSEDKEWQVNSGHGPIQFSKIETLEKLGIKSGNHKRSELQLFDTHTLHHKL